MASADLSPLLGLISALVQLPRLDCGTPLIRKFAPGSSVPLSCKWEVNQKISHFRKGRPQCFCPSTPGLKQKPAGNSGMQCWVTYIPPCQYQLGVFSRCSCWIFLAAPQKKSWNLKHHNKNVWCIHFIYIYIYIVCVKFLSLDTEEQLSASGNTGFVSCSTVYLFSRRLEEMHCCNNSMSTLRFSSASVCLTHSEMSFTLRSSLYCFLWKEELTCAHVQLSLNSNW